MGPRRPLGPIGGIVRRKRANYRNTFLAAPLALVALNLGLAATLDRQPALRDPIYYAKEDLLAKRLAGESHDRVVVVALGSSRTGNAFHPITAEREISRATGKRCVAFNISLPGGGPVTQLVHLRRLLKRGIKPDIVLVEIIPSMCAERDGTPPEMAHLRPDRVSLAELDELTALGAASDEYRDEWVEAVANPWFGFRFQLLGFIQPKWTPPGVVKGGRKFPDPTGWHPWAQPVTPETYLKDLATAHGEHFDNLQRLEVGRVASEALDEIYATCRREGIVAIPVITPEGADFRAWYGTKAQAATAALLASGNAGTGGRAVDAREWLPDNAFADGHHVQQGFAPDFTRRLVKEALLPALEK